MAFHDAFITIPGTIGLDSGPSPPTSGHIAGRPSQISSGARSPFSNHDGAHVLEGVLELEGILRSGGGPSRAGSRLTVTVTPLTPSGQPSPSGKPSTPVRAAMSSLSQSASGALHGVQSYEGGGDGTSGRLTMAGGPMMSPSHAWGNQSGNPGATAASPRGQHSKSDTKEATNTSVTIGIRPVDPSAIPAAPSPSQSCSLRPPSRAPSYLSSTAAAPTSTNSSPNTPRGYHTSSTSIPAAPGTPLSPTGAASASPAGPAFPRPLVSTPSFSGPAIRTSGGSKVSPLSSPLGRAPGAGLFARMSSGLKNRSASGWVEEGGLQRRPSGMAWSASGACPPDGEASSTGHPGPASGDVSPVTPIGLPGASIGFSRRLEDLPAAPSPAHARSLQSPARSPASYGSPRTTGEVDASRETRRSLDSPRGAGTPRPPQHSSSGGLGVQRVEQQQQRQQQQSVVVVAAINGPEHVMGLPSPRRLKLGPAAGVDGGRGDVLVRSGSRLGLEEGAGGGRGGGAAGPAGSRVWGVAVGCVVDGDDGIDVVEVL